MKMASLLTALSEAGKLQKRYGFDDKRDSGLAGLP